MKSRVFFCRFVMVLGLIGLAAGVYGQNTFTILEGFSKRSAGTLLEYYRDDDGTMGLAEVSSQTFEQSTANIPNFGWTHAVYWFRLNLEDRRVDRSENLILEVDWPLLDTLDVYFLDGEGQLQKLVKTGDVLKSTSKEIRISHFAFRIPTRAKQTVYIRAQAEDTTTLPLTIWSENKFLESSVFRSLGWGLFFGMVVLMFIYSGFMGIFLRDRLYFLYALYLVAMGFFELSYTGLGYTYLWGWFKGFQNVSLTLSMALFYIISTRFTQAFLGTEGPVRGIQIHFAIFMGICAATVPLHLVLSPLVLGILLNVLVFYGGGLIMLSSLIMVFHHYKPARYFFAAWACYVLGGLLLVFKDFQILESNLVTNYAIHFGFAFQIILFLLGIADRVYIIKKEREQYFQDYQAEQAKVIAAQEAEYKESQRRLKITEVYTRKSIVEAIRNGDDPTSYLPTEKNLTVLFSDIRDFTGISEKLDPIETIDLLNSYFNDMNRAIIQNHGEIDKLIGDCIMALFADPDSAVRAAIKMRRNLVDLNRTYKTTIRINNGVGINYGNVVLGNIGSENKMDFTVIGDIVNTASRLEALTKYYGLPLIISEDLKGVLKGDYKMRFIDTVVVKGRNQPIKIYEIFDFDKEEIVDLKFQNQSSMEEAFDFYQRGDFEEASKLYRELIFKVGPHSYRPKLSADPVLDYYLERCGQLQLQQKVGTLREWKGVYEFTEK